jgi:hypothetical protein
MALRLVLVAGLSLMLFGCFSSVRVQRSASLADEPHGIPFYAKTGMCKQQTVWLEPQYIFMYEAKMGNDTFGPVDKVLNREQYLKVQDFIAAPKSPQDWKAIIFALPGPETINESDAEQIKKEEASGNWIRASNTGTVEAVVDYGNVFYLNSARPLAGSTQVSAKLAADGTLTEASAQVQDQTLQTIASTISSLVGSASTAAKILGLEAQVEYKLTVKTKVYSHAHVQYVEVKNNEKISAATPINCNAVNSGVFGGSFTVAEVPDSAGAKPPSDKENTVTISGSIVLPKAQAPATPAPSPPAPKTPPSSSPKTP